MARHSKVAILRLCCLLVLTTNTFFSYHAVISYLYRAIGISHGDTFKNDKPFSQHAPVMQRRMNNNSQSGTHYPIGDKYPPTSAPPTNDGDRAEPQDTCTPKHNIVFLKTHKAGSSTVQNIVLRYGEKHKLTFALPKRRGVSENNAGWPHHFDKQYLIETPGKGYNIFAFHCRFAHKELSAVMPTGSIYFTILREPVSLYESMFRFFFTTNIRRQLKLKGDFTKAAVTFLSDPRRYYNADRSFPLVRNPMMFDMGMSVDEMDDERAVLRKIAELEGALHFVMISEYFDESLVLLRHLLCWKVDDIAYLANNVRINAERKLKGTDSLAEKIEQWNQADVMLYRHFNATFWERIQSFGADRMEKEVWQFREKLEKSREFCVQRSKAGLSITGAKVVQYELNEGAENNLDCQRMITTELDYLNYIKLTYQPSK
ncbi:galactosylceramide sulfotransferase-like [Ptychodera flava]|uniref:galactosylceramide sulfotransferase-like n=1 Tax=Ptychodera flava TaxID=63121 RepID=UPI00396A21AB